jgi:PAS domain S-box-containing protein
LLFDWLFISNKDVDSRRTTVEFLKTVSSSSRFLPNGYCYLWNSRLIWLCVVSDALIALACLSIAINLAFFVRKRRDLPSNWMFIFFGAFILAIGATQAMEVWSVLDANYWLSGAFKIVAAAASFPTCILLVRLIPEALALPSPAALRFEIAERKRTQEALKGARLDLELRVHERSAEFRKLNQELVTEITQRQKIEGALRRSEEQFRLLVDRVRDYAIVSLNPYGTITSWNAGAEHIRGYSADEVIGRHFSCFYPSEDVEHGKPESELAIAVAEGRLHAEGRRARKDGSIFWADVVITALRNERGELLGFSKLTHDLSERKQAEQALREANAKLANLARVTSTGELTASIAHEINQPLSAIVNNANACRRMLSQKRPDLDEVRQGVLEIADAGTRAGEVIARARELFKKAAAGRTRLNMNEVIQDVLTLTRAEVKKHNVSVLTEFDTGLPCVLGDKVQLQQVILNLVINGIEAMTSINDRPRILLIRSRIQEPGKVSVAVQDCGSGLMAQDPAQLFDTFFTTKPQGLGMGLPISRSILEAHGGRLRLIPNEEQGATSEFTLPACA